MKPLLYVSAGVLGTLLVLYVVGIVGQKQEQQEIARALCPDLVKMAEAAAKARYAGTPKSTLVRMVDQGDMPLEVRELARSMVDAAYRLPHWDNEQNQVEQIAEFRAQFEQKCQGKGP
jgi:hypothetical protein